MKSWLHSLTWHLCQNSSASCHEDPSAKRLERLALDLAFLRLTFGIPVECAYGSTVTDVPVSKC